jgi:hypothetical protein
VTTERNATIVVVCPGGGVMVVQFIGSIAVITPDTSRSRSLYLD